MSIYPHMSYVFQFLHWRLAISDSLRKRGRGDRFGGRDDRVALPIPLRGEILVDAVWKNVDLLCDKRQQRRRLSLAGTQRKGDIASYGEETRGLPMGASGYQTAVDGWIGLAKNSRLTKMNYTADPLLNQTGPMPNGEYRAVIVECRDAVDLRHEFGRARLRHAIDERDDRLLRFRIVP